MVTSNRKYSVLLLRLFVVVTMLLLIVIVIQMSYKNKEPKSPLPTTMTWDHRGYQDSATQTENTIESYDRAIAMGAEGIEMDIFYDEGLSDFVVSHDTPYQRQADSTVLMLSGVLGRYHADIYYWLDLKNLRSSNTSLVAQRLEELIDSLQLDNKIYVESGKALVARKLSKYKAINTILWIQYNSKKWGVAGLKKLYYKALIAMGDFSGVSRGYLYADEDFREAFGTFPCFIFHIYDAEQYNDALSWVPKGSVLLVDSPYYQNAAQ